MDRVRPRPDVPELTCLCPLAPHSSYPEPSCETSALTRPETVSAPAVYETLLRRAWANRGNGDTKVVRTFVKQLRGKLGDDASKPSWIFNVRGVAPSSVRSLR